MLVGGTGFYYRALTRGLFPGPAADEDLRRRLNRVADRRGVERLHRMLQQMPDVFDLICRTVRAGNTFWHGVNSVSDEFEAPISTEFAYCHEMHNLGLPSELALREMARRTGLVEMKLLAEAVTVQQQAGGNLVEVLDKLTMMIRERFRIHGTIRTLTAEEIGRAHV